MALWFPCPVQIASRAAESPLPSIRTRLSVRRQATHSRFREAPQRAFYTLCSGSRLAWLRPTKKPVSRCPSMSGTDREFNLERFARALWHQHTAPHKNSIRFYRRSVAFKDAKLHTKSLHRPQTQRTEV